MIGVITDLCQSAAIIMWGILVIVIARRVKRLEGRPATKVFHLPEAGPSTNLGWKPAEDPQPVCGCTHHLCFHDENGCSKIEAITYVDRNELERIPTACGCKRYTGPEQLPTVIP